MKPVPQRTVPRVRSCVATPQTGRFCCAPDFGEGLNNVLKGGRFSSPVAEPVYD